MVRNARFRSVAMVGAMVLGVALVVPLTSLPAGADGCTAPTNPVACENSLPGTPGWGDDSDSDIEGFTTEMSTNQGGTVSFKVNTVATDYRIDVYRQGWYGGVGARKVATVQPSAPLPQDQPSCLTVPSTGLVDCSNWAVSATWAVPAAAVSGVYRAVLVREDGVASTNHITFVIRSDTSQSDLVVQTSDTTWQAYNVWGGNSLYQGAPGRNPSRAYKVSYNRPMALGQYYDGFETGEYAFVRWIERNGYDVSYISGVDTDRNGGLLLNHKAFLSVGHDEYWSAAQRTNVQAARDAGVDLAFFSGNEMYWKTRWESGADGGDRRTLVSYKESYSSTRLDPTGIWTGTWQDPRNGGGQPSNSLTGTLFVMNGLRFDAMTVPDAYQPPRLWRGIAGMDAPTPDGVLGMEWDTVPDNGKQPPGLIKLSSTTVTSSNAVVTDINGPGITFGAGTATHSLTMYRAASGALVFSAGLTQWSWALDPNHSRATMATDPRIEQATVNLLADFGAQPRTLRSGLSAATASTDTTGASAAFTSPASGASVPAGQAVSISGTASDSGGGVPAGVEVSTDGGSTWHPAAPGANGYATWSYTWTPTSTGSVTLRARATDDSANLGATTTRTVSVSTPSCPCTLFGSTVPTNPTVSDGAAVELGVQFTTSSIGYVTGVRFYKGNSTNGGTHVGRLWTSSGSQLASATFQSESASGWQSVNFANPVLVMPGTTYVASYLAPQGHYAGDAGFFASPYSRAPLTATSGRYRYATSGGFPNTSSTSNYWVDVTFSTNLFDSTPPSVTSTVPANGATGVSTTTAVTATLSESIVSGATLSLTSNGTPVPGTSSYTSTTRTMRFTPTAALATSTTYVATLTGVADAAGNAMAPYSWSFTTTGPATCSAATPCTLLGSRVPAMPTVADNSALAVGLRFSSSVSGSITGVRFYKGGTSNGGTHTGRLWTASGTLLATVTFQNETTSGWQTATFSTPVAITAGTTYVASYHAPVGNYSADPGFFQSPFTNGPLTGTSGSYQYGGATTFPSTTVTHSYAVDVLFATGSVPDTTPPTLTATTPASGATGVSTSTAITATVSEAIQAGAALSLTSGGSAVAGSSSYDAGTRTLRFTPTAALNPSTTYTATATGVRDTAGNAMADQSWSFTTAAPGDTTPPSITTRTPAAGATGVSVSTAITATVSEAIQAGAALTLTSGGSAVAGSSSYDAGTRTLRFTPTAALDPGTTYTATATGVRDTAGNAMADSPWNFTTAPASSPCTASAPCSVFGSDTPAIPTIDDGAVELGMVFSSSIDGEVTGVRFYKGDATNGGTHVGRLWSSTGTLLASATFVAETTSGWQTVLFSTPVAITAGTQYVVSYFAPQGGYSGDVNGLATPVTNGPLTALGARYQYGTGGVFPTATSPHNYWIDVLFTSG